MKLIFVFLGLAVVGSMARRPGGGNGQATKPPGGQVGKRPGGRFPDEGKPGNGPACTCSIEVIQSNGVCRRGKVLRNSPGCQCNVQIIRPGVPPVGPPGVTTTGSPVQPPTDEPIFPTEEPILPTEEPVLPTDEPIFPTDEPIEPTEEPPVEDEPIKPCRITDQPCRKGNKTSTTGRPKPTHKPRNPGRPVTPFTIPGRRPVTRPPREQGGKKPGNGNVGRFPDDSTPANGQGCVCSIQIVQSNGVCRQGKVLRSSGGCQCKIEIVMGNGSPTGPVPPVVEPPVEPIPCFRESPSEPCRKRNKTSGATTGRPSKPTPPSARPSRATPSSMRPATVPNASGRPGNVTPKPGPNNRPVRGRKIDISNSINNDVIADEQAPEPAYPEEPFQWQ